MVLNNYYCDNTIKSVSFPGMISKRYVKDAVTSQNASHNELVILFIVDSFSVNILHNDKVQVSTIKPNFIKRKIWFCSFSVIVSLDKSDCYELQCTYIIICTYMCIICTYYMYYSTYICIYICIILCK